MLPGAVRRPWPPSESRRHRDFPQLFFDFGQVVDDALGSRHDNARERRRAFHSQLRECLVKISQVIGGLVYHLQERVKRGVDDVFVGGFGIHQSTLRQYRRGILAELRRRKPDYVIATNVEFYSAVVLDLAEVPPDLTPAMFACSRVAGWAAHILEEKRTGRLIRPSAQYVGPGQRSIASVG